jgi:fibro-slime domain-containing protein
MKKRVLSFVLAVVMLIGLLPSVALFQASAAEVGDTHTVTYGTLNTKKSVSLPITVHNYPNDGMLFEYSSYVSSEDYNYAHAHAEKVTPGYGESWYIYTGHTEMVAGTSMTYLGTYYIASKKDKNYLLCHDTTSDNGVKLFSHWSASIPEGNRRWKAYRDSSGHFQFVNIGSGKALDKNGNQTNLHGWTPNAGANQQWNFVANGDGSYKIFSVANSGLIVVLANGTVADGNTISLYGEDNGTPAQSWYLVPVSGCEADLSGLAGNAMHVTRTASDEASGIGAYATVLEQGMIKENARYLTLVYNVSNETANQFGDEAAQPFKLVPVNGEHGYAVDVSGGTASDGQKIQLWSSPDNNTNTTKYVLPEAAGDGSYYLRWYKCEANGSFAATDFYIGGVTGINQDVSCKKRESANRFHILQNADGSYLIRFADADYYGEPLYLYVSRNNMADGTRVLSWVWTGNSDERYYFSKFNGTRITYGTENYRVYPGFDGQSTAYADVQANGVNAALTAAPGYHTVTIDLASSAGFSAAEMISSLSASTPAGKRATLSLAAAGLFSTQSEAEQFGKAALCGLSDSLSYGGYTATFQWVGTSVEDYNARGNTVGNRVRKYRMGNNLAFGMLLPNSGYGGANYQAFNNFGYAWGNASDTTVPTNLANGKWLPYAVLEYPYTISGSNDGRWFVNGSQTYNENYPTATVNGTNYTDVSKFLPNMHSYIEGMATIGLVNYEIDPETKALTYTQQTVQKLAEMLKQSLAIPEKNGDDYNYNFVQGAKLSGNKDWAQLIREYLATCPNRDVTSTTESNWASYTQGHKSLLDLSWSDVTNGSYKSNFNNYLDVAYWMLNTLYKDNNGISQTVPEYTHMTLSQETNSAGNTYYVFDGGYDGVTYNANDGSISHVNGSSSKDMVYYTTESDTTLHPFLPTTGSTTFRQTNTPYFLDSGASERSAASFESQIGRDYNFSMEGHGQFVFNAEDNLYFTFEGDDDVYLFINNKMVMDIGAAHSITKSTFNLNDYIKECGLKDGEMYNFDFYYMERHSYGSNIRIETNIDVTSKYIDTVKGATQNGTVVENGGLVDKTKELDYYITLLNNGYELPLKNVAFTDEQVSFAAGYDGVSLGSYTLNGTTYNRKIEDIKIVLTKADGSEINLTFASTGALQTFLTNVTCAGHETPGLQVGERLTLYGIKHGLTRDGTFRNTAYAEASALRTSSTFSVYAGAAQQYFMWAGHPIAVSASDAASVATNSSKVTSFIPSSANGTTVSLRPLADGVYSIGIWRGRNYSWSPKGKSGELQSWNANNLYEDSTEGNEPLFYVKYAGNGYYTIYNLQYEQYVSIDAASGTNPASTGAVDVDDRLKLVSLTEAEAQANDTTLWLIERNNGISPNSDQNAYTIRPKLAPKYGVDLDAGTLTNGVKLHLWDVASSTNCGWYFNAHANGDGNMTGFEDDILIFEEQTPGTYTHYFKATYSNGDEVNVPVVLHVLDAKDDTYVLDYGLPVNLNDANDGGLTLNDPIRPTGIEINTLIEGLVSGEAYNGLKQLSKDGKLTTKTNGVSGNTTDQYISTYGTFTADNGDASAHSSRNVSNIELSTSADTGWSDTKPSSGTYETRTVYRYRDKTSKTETGAAKYVNFPSYFDTSNSLYAKYNGKQMSGVTTTSTSTVGYVYWHWCTGGTDGPYWRNIGYTKGQNVNGAAQNTFHAWEDSRFATSISGGVDEDDSYSFMSGTGLNLVGFYSPGEDWNVRHSNSYSKQYCSYSILWFATPIYQQNWSKTTESWGNWSDWSTSIATASSTRQVETKTQYRSTGSGGSGSDTPVDLDFSTRKAYRIAFAADPNWVLSINDASSADWSDTIPTGYSESQCETRTMYRYQDMTTKTNSETHQTKYIDSISDLSPYAGSHELYKRYQVGPTTGSGISTVSTTDAGWVLWHYCGGETSARVDRYIGWHYNQTDAAQYGIIYRPLTVFHSWESSSNPASFAGKEDYSMRYECGWESTHYTIPGIYYSAESYIPQAAKNVCGEGYRWFYTPLHLQTWTKTTTTSEWSGVWSAWSDAPVEATATRKVETKTQYRLKADVTSASGTNIALQARDDFNTAQLWYFENQSDGSVTITNAKTDMTMQLKANAGNGVQLVQKQTADASKDRWTLVKNSNNTIAIHPASNANQSVDLTDGKKQQNQNIQIWSSQATNANQQWILSPIYQSDTYTRVLFTPTRIMSGASTTKAIVRVHRSSEKPSIGLGNVDVHNEVEMYESLTTIPASVVYYEDNFAGIDYNTNTNSKIDNIGGGDGDYQDADQTGQYGHDSSYEGEGTETSGGSVTKITVLNDEQVASFKFRGTGFEIISRCSAQRSATIVARVYDVSGNQIRNIPVITEYDNNGDDQGSETIYQAPVISVNDLPAGDYTVRIFVNARANLEGWKVTYDSYDAATGDVKYTMTDAKGNTYTKYYNITTGKSRFVDANGKACNNPMLEESFLYIDGVRIFNPIEGVKDNNGNALDDAYLDNEQGADILQIHDQIEVGKMTATEVNAEEVKLGTGFSSFSENRNNNFIHGNKVDSIEAYSTIGPNNELYLDGLSLTQALGFYVKPDDSVPMTERTLQIGVRALDANALHGYTTVVYESVPIDLLQSNDNGGSPAWTKLASVTSGTEQYYVIDPTLCTYDAGKGAYLVMLRPQNGMVSLTGLKVKGYTLLPIFDPTRVSYDADGKLTDDSIDVVNGMLEQFVPVTTSNVVVEARSASNGTTAIVIGQGDPADETPSGSSDTELPIDPVEPTPDPVDPKPDDPKPDDPKPDDPSQPDAPEKEPAFADIAGQWYESYVELVAEAGIIKGYDDGLFHGDNHVTREEFAAMLVRALGLTDNGKACAFTDISGRWSEEAIRIAAQNGLVNGVNATTFAPDAEITRQEMMTMIARALKATGLNVTGSDDLSGYADANEVSGWALSSVRTLVASGIISGDNGKLNPTGTCTRSEAAAVFSRLLALLK